MMCPKCKAIDIKPIQESKEDYWLCLCGSYHKGFPYDCPLKEFKRKIIKSWNDSSSYRDFQESIFYDLELRKGD